MTKTKQTAAQAGIGPTRPGIGRNGTVKSAEMRLRRNSRGLGGVLPFIHSPMVSEVSLVDPLLKRFARVL